MVGWVLVGSLEYHLRSVQGSSAESVVGWIHLKFWVGGSNVWMGHLGRSLVWYSVGSSGWLGPFVILGCWITMGLIQESWVQTPKDSHA